MHSHYGLQEQLYNSAPLIIWTPEERAKADRQVVVMLSDFSFTPPEQILKGLKGGMQPMDSTKGIRLEKRWKSWISGKMSGTMGDSCTKRSRCSEMGRSEAKACSNNPAGARSGH